MKYFLHLFAVALLFPAIAFGAEAGTGGTYTLMAPLGPLSGSVDLTKYLQGVVQVAIGLAGLLAVIMIVICGIKLMGTPSASAKSEAKECVWNALLGLLIAVGAYAILYTINPLLLAKEVKIGGVAVAPPTATPPSTVNEPMPTAPGVYFQYEDERGTHFQRTGDWSMEVCAQLLPVAEKAGKKILETNSQKCFQILPQNTPVASGELSTRESLCGNKSCVGSTPVGINRAPCNPPEANGITNRCTNVAGLPTDTVGFIKGLPGPLIVTGGTENGHVSHAKNVPVFDLDNSVSLIKFIEKNGTGPNPSFCNTGTGTCFSKWLYSGYWFTKEGNHYHVCKEGTSAPAGADARQISVFKKACTKI